MIFYRCIKFRDEFIEHRSLKDVTAQSRIPSKMTIRKDSIRSEQLISKNSSRQGGLGYVNRYYFGLIGKPDITADCDLTIHGKVKKGLKMPIEFKTGQKRENDVIQCSLYLLMMNPERLNKAATTVSMLWYYDELGLIYSIPEVDAGKIMDCFIVRNCHILENRLSRSDLAGNFIEEGAGWT
jgi:hypothetical protein